MLNKTTSIWVAAGIALLFASSAARAQSQRTEHIYKLDDPATRPAATLNDVALHFSGLSFYRSSDSTMDAWIVMKTSDGVVEEKLEYVRVSPDP